MNDYTLNEENFWPSITQTDDGEFYLIDGARSSIIKIEGLNSIKRLPTSSITISKSDLIKSRSYLLEIESNRQKIQGHQLLKVPIVNSKIIVDGKFNDWSKTNWADIDKGGVKANFNSNSKPYNITGSAAISGDRLYVGFKTGDARLLLNSGEMPIAPFKTGGALDVMIGANPSSDTNRRKPVDGDARILVTVIKGKPKALLYSAVIKGTKEADKTTFSSPWRTVLFDKVEDISARIEFAESKDGNYEISIPLELLNLKPKEGMEIKGDIGILRGDGKQTISRVYWNNKATSIVSDVPSEAELTPELWGTWKFVGSN